MWLLPRLSEQNLKQIIFEGHQEKTFLHMRKQRRRTAAQYCAADQCLSLPLLSLHR